MSHSTQKVAFVRAALFLLLVPSFTLPSSAASRDVGFPPLATESQIGWNDQALIDATELLTEQIRIIQTVSPFLESYEKQRLTMLIAYTERVIEALRDPKRGLGHKETFELFLDLIGAIDASEALFLQISEAEEIKPSIQRMTETQKRLVETYGFERTSYTLNLHRMLVQMKSLLDELSRNQIPESLKHELKALTPTLGYATVAAASGDRPLAFSRVKPVTQMISRLYESLNRLSLSKPIFNTTLSIQFINERMIEYGQYEREAAHAR